MTAPTKPPNRPPDQAPSAAAFAALEPPPTCSCCNPSEMAPGTAPITAPHLARFHAECFRESMPRLISMLLNVATATDIDDVFPSGRSTSVSEVDASTCPVTSRMSSDDTRILAPVLIAGACAESATGHRQTITIRVSFALITPVPPLQRQRHDTRQGSPWQSSKISHSVGAGDKDV